MRPPECAVLTSPYRAAMAYRVIISSTCSQSSMSLSILRLRFLSASAHAVLLGLCLGLSASPAAAAAAAGLRYSGRRAGSRLGPARVAGLFVRPRHTDGMGGATTPLDPCACEMNAPRGDTRRTGPSGGPFPAAAAASPCSCPGAWVWTRRPFMVPFTAFQLCSDSCVIPATRQGQGSAWLEW